MAGGVVAKTGVGQHFASAEKPVEKDRPFTMRQQQSPGNSAILRRKDWFMRG
jgi:hypothetical protein